MTNTERLTESSNGSNGCAEVGIESYEAEIAPLAPEAHVQEQATAVCDENALSKFNSKRDSKAEKARLAEEPDPGEAETWRVYVGNDSSVATAVPKPGTSGLNKSKLKRDSKAEKARLAEEPDPGESWRVYIGEDSSVVAVISKLGRFDLNKFKFKLKLVHVNECGEIPTCDALTAEEAYEASEEACRELEREGHIYDSGERMWSNQTQRYEIVWKATCF